MSPSRFAVLDLDDEHCLGCGEVLGILDVLYCGKVTCQEMKRNSAGGARARAVSDARARAVNDARALAGDARVRVTGAPGVSLKRAQSERKEIIKEKPIPYSKTYDAPTISRYGQYGPTPYDGPTVPRYGQYAPTNERYSVFDSHERVSFGPVAVTARTTTTFQVTPQYPLHLERLVVPSGVATYFDICDIRVGNMSIFPSSMPASAFTEFSIGLNIGLPTLMVGMMLALSVANKTDEVQFFSAIFFATADC